MKINDTQLSLVKDRIRVLKEFGTPLYKDKLAHIEAEDLKTLEDFEALPYGSEGLWRKLMHQCREKATLEEILTAVKSKRYTRSRLDRMVMCAFLGLTAQDLTSPAPYARVLALNDKGREILKTARPNIGEKADHPYGAIENRCGTLYGLFSTGTPETPDVEANYRVYYQK